MTRQQLGRTVAQKVFPLVEIANSVPPISFMLRGRDRSFGLNVDGEQLFIVTTGGYAQVLLSSPPQRPQVSFGLTEQTLDLLIAGRISPLTAKLTGRLNSTGPTADILLFAAVVTACLKRLRKG